MKKYQKEAVLISFLNDQPKYDKLADYMLNLIKDDPASPKESLHTITYRIKDSDRLIEKIDEENKQITDNKSLITLKNYKERIGDLLGIRLICLRLSDISTLKAYLDLLADEKILRFIWEPDHKRSFILPVDPGEAIPDGLNLRYSGYSSIHYQIELGKNVDAPNELKGIQIELQLRTILEEAWGEIDHKYRYVFSRNGDTLPDHIHTGFYNLSAYLQAAALQAEHLCRQTEEYRLSRLPNKTAVPEPVQPVISDAFAALLENAFGFKPTKRTLIYILRRIDKFGHGKDSQIVFQKIFTKNRLKEFEMISRGILNRDAFKDNTQKNFDAINAVNFALAYQTKGSRVSKEGLRSILKWKKERSG